MLRKMCLLIPFFLVGACHINGDSHDLPETLGEGRVVASYIPLDPLPVFSSRNSRSCGGKSGNEKTPEEDNNKWKSLLDSLPDQTVRMVVASYNNSGNLSFGPISLGAKGKSYKVVLDYTNVDAVSVPLVVNRKTGSQSVGLFSTPDTVSTYEVYRIDLDANYKEGAIQQLIKAQKGLQSYGEFAEIINVTVYVGVGLRLTANVTVLDGEANLGSLGALAADAASGKTSGSLVVQTLGVTGKTISTTLPLPSELNQTTIQNAILAIGGIKAVLHDEENTKTHARVVGIYNPVGGNTQLVNAIHNAIASKPIIWYRPCVESSKSI
ncbi:hypothetical protein [Pseudoalteromonas sp. GB56]